MFDDQIRLEARMKPAVHTYIRVAKGSDHKTVQSTNRDGLTWGSTVYVTTP